MKRKKILTLLLICPLLLTSCSGNENAITAVYNYDIIARESIPDHDFSYYIDVDSGQILNLIDSGNEFIFFMWSEGCGHCETAMPLIQEYLRDKGCNQSIYRFEYSYAGYEKLITSHPEMFPNEVATPRMFTAKDGEVAYEIRASRLEHKSTIKSSLNQCTEFANLYYLSQLESYELFQEEFSDYSIFTYDSTDLDSCKEYKTEFNKALASGEVTLFIDTVEAEEDLLIALGIEVVTSEDLTLEESQDE